ncbi:uncharacterized protein LOC106866789 [Brachypodium distachyon]|uniref:uncharacterized protein LOC106866789 n=1 Tax=Brachypodium distachyon TaxID=15368 RepID=UPI000D0D59EC|nr:uncharacterized protein LOC106866789 [Brachypodium distachyon]|eukprot:XP_024318736.1 uncharacterized protein LOC106866789 [Brachypodium distachyon]
MPSVALFRHYFYPRVEQTGAMSSGVSFRAREKMKSEFIVRSDKKIEKEWHAGWGWVRVEEPDEFLHAPTELPEAHGNWGDRDAELLPIVKKIKALRLAGLTDLDVAHTYISRRIAPLQWRTCPAWMYTGPGDNTCLQREGVSPEAIRTWVKGIIGEDAPFMDLSPGAASLHADVAGLHDIVGSYPPFNEWGLMSEPPASAPQPPPPTTRGKQVAEESDVESEPGWSSDEPSGGETRGGAGVHVVVLEAVEDDEPLVRRPRAPAAGVSGGSSSSTGPTAPAALAAPPEPTTAATPAPAAVEATPAASAAAAAVAIP